MHFSYTAATICGDKLFFSDNSINGFFKMNLDGFEAEYIGAFPDEEICKCNIHKNAFVYRDKVIFTPNQGNNVHVFDVNNSNIFAVPIHKECDTRYAFSESVIIKDTLYIMPGNLLQPIITVNLDNYVSDVKTVYLKSLFDGAQLDGQFFCRAEAYGEAVYCPILNSSKIVRYDIEDNSWSVLDTHISDLFGISILGEEFVLSTTNSGIYVWNYKTKEIRELKIGDDIKIRGYTLIKKNDTSVFCVPDMGGTVCLYSKNGPEWSDSMDLFDLCRINKDRIMGGIYEMGLSYKEKLIVFPTYYTSLAIWNEGKKNNVDISLKNRDVFFETNKAKKLLESKIQQEGRLFDLRDYVCAI